MEKRIEEGNLAIGCYLMPMPESATMDDALRLCGSVVQNIGTGEVSTGLGSAHGGIERYEEFTFDKIYRDQNEFHRTGYNSNIAPLVKRAMACQCAIAMIGGVQPTHVPIDHPLHPRAIMLSLLCQSAGQLLNALNGSGSVKQGSVTFGWYAIDCNAKESISDVLRRASGPPPASSAGANGPAVGGGGDSNLMLRESGKGRGMVVPGLWEVEIASGADIEAVVSHVQKVMSSTSNLRPGSADSNAAAGNLQHTVMQLTVTNRMIQAEEKNTVLLNKHNATPGSAFDPPGVGRLTFVLISNLHPLQHQDTLASFSPMVSLSNQTLNNNSNNNENTIVETTASGYFYWVEHLYLVMQWLESRRASPPFHKSRLLLLLRDALWGRQAASALMLLQPSRANHFETVEWLRVMARIATKHSSSPNASSVSMSAPTPVPIATSQNNNKSNNLTSTSNGGSRANTPRNPARPMATTPAATTRSAEAGRGGGSLPAGGMPFPGDGDISNRSSAARSRRGSEDIPIDFDFDYDEQQQAADIRPLPHDLLPQPAASNRPASGEISEDPTGGSRVRGQSSYEYPDMQADSFSRSMDYCPSLKEGPGIRALPPTRPPRTFPRASSSSSSSGGASANDPYNDNSNYENNTNNKNDDTGINDVRSRNRDYQHPQPSAQQQPPSPTFSAGRGSANGFPSAGVQRGGVSRDPSADGAGAASVAQRTPSPFSVISADGQRRQQQQQQQQREGVASSGLRRANSTGRGGVLMRGGSSVQAGSGSSNGGGGGAGVGRKGAEAAVTPSNSTRFNDTQSMNEGTEEESERALRMALEASRSEAAALRIAYKYANDKFEESKNAHEALLQKLKEEGSMLAQRDRDRYRGALKDIKDYEIYKNVMEAAMSRMQTELEALTNENKRLKNTRTSEERTAVRHRTFSERYSKDLVATKKKLGDVEAKLSEKEKQLKAALKDREVAVATLAQIKSAGSQREGQIRMSNNLRLVEIEELKKKLTAAEELTKALEIDKKSILASTDSEIASLRTAHGKALETLMSYQEENDLLRATVAELSASRHPDQERDYKDLR